MIDPAKIRRETMRWNILLILNNGRPNPTYEGLVLSTMQVIFADATALEVRREMDYLDERALIKVRREPSGNWFCELTRDGVDVVEYTVDCDAGISRPAKYW